MAEAGLFARRLGRLDQAIAIGEYQVALDPINPYGHEILAYSYRFAGRLDDAIATLRTLLQPEPGLSRRPRRHWRNAAAERRRQGGAGRDAAGSPGRHASCRVVDGSSRTRPKAESDAALAELIEKYGSDYSFNIAYVFAFRGDADRSFEWLNKAVEYHDLYLSAVAVHPMFASLHSDARWLPFLRKHGMAPEQLAAIKFDVKLPQ